MNDKSLRDHLKNLSAGTTPMPTGKPRLQAFRPKIAASVRQAVPHSVWELFEHMRLAQRDILNFCINPKYVSPEWPSGYWPKHSAPLNAAAWNKTVKEFQSDLDAMAKLAANPKIDLFARIPHGSGQTILREALLLAGHNSYHLGQIVMVRKLLGDWPAN